MRLVAAVGLAATGDASGARPPHDAASRVGANVTAAAHIDGAAWTPASAAARGEVNRAGGIASSTGGPCEPSWLPTFGGKPGANDTVHALAVHDDGSGAGPALYAGGAFTTAGGVAANSIARWDGSSWSPLGSGMDGDVRALAVYDDGSGAGPALYAGGLFTTAGGVAVNNIARWDGSSWTPVGGGVGSQVNALTVFDDGSGAGTALYAGGSFTAAGGVGANNIARWDGSAWTPVGAGMNSQVNALTVFDDGSGAGTALYAGGSFTSAGGAAANYLALWDGSGWSPLGSGMNSNVSALAVYDDGSGAGPALYAGGQFTIAGGGEANRIGRWDGSVWTPLGAGVSSHVTVLTACDDGSAGGPALYAGGSFTAAGGVDANRIARWDGSAWTSLGSGMNRVVLALMMFDDGSGTGPALFAGGSFTSAGGVEATRIARWNGSGWMSLGSGMNSVVLALTVFDDGSGAGAALYAGGSFTTAGGVPANRVARWDGSAWTPLGSGMNSNVLALAVHDDGSGAGHLLYAGGTFTTAGRVAANGIARWDGSAWTPLGSGMSIIFALTAYEGGSGAVPALYAGGTFTTAGGVAANSIASWDGSAWTPLSSGMNDTVSALAVYDDGSGAGPALYAGGWFTTAGGVTANHIARWDGWAWTPLGSGMDSTVFALAVHDDGSGAGPALYAGGWFTTAGGVAANGIARWDGSAWTPLGSGLTLTFALAAYDDGSGAGLALYAGGYFTAAGGVAANSIAQWDGSAWTALGSGISGGANSSVSALTVYDDGSGTGPALYAGGSFSVSPAGDSFLAKWGGCACVADADGNGTVNVEDLLLIIIHWGTSHPGADLDDNGVVDVEDLVLVITNWGECG